MSISRRNFISNLSLAFGSVMFVPACSGFHSVWRFFTNDESNILIPMAEQIIPADSDPGATDANVVNFIDRQLVGPYTRFQEIYRKGLNALQNTCQQKFSLNFQDLDWDIQTSLLVDLESNNVPENMWTEVQADEFFSTVIEHCMQGFYGSPRHGGNKNYVSYKMMGLDYPHVIGQNRYVSQCATLFNLKP